MPLASRNEYRFSVPDYYFINPLVWEVEIPYDSYQVILITQEDTYV